MRYLLDSNVLVAAFRSRNGASNAVLRRVLTGNLRVVVHYKLVAEYRDVLSRRDTLIRTPFTFSEVERVLARLVADADEVKVRYLWRPNLPDEGDNFIIEIAVAAAPCTIVTHNIKDFRRSELGFAGVALCTPGTLLQELTD